MKVSGSISPTALRPWSSRALTEPQQEALDQVVLSGVTLWETLRQPFEPEKLDSALSVLATAPVTEQVVKATVELCAGAFARCRKSATDRAYWGQQTELYKGFSEGPPIEEEGRTLVQAPPRIEGWAQSSLKLLNEWGEQGYELGAVEALRTRPEETLWTDAGVKVQQSHPRTRALVNSLQVRPMDKEFQVDPQIQSLAQLEQKDWV